MKRILVLFLVLSLQATAQSNLNKIDSLLQYYNTHNKMMGQFAMKLANNNIYKNAFGHKANPTIVVTNDSRFRIGSITKMFTATLILQLVEEKKLNLNDKINRFFPDLEKGKQISIEMLLRHRSGIPDYNLNQYLDLQNTNQTKEAVINKICQQALEFEPDSKTKFSNSNYLLLGQIIEQLTQKTYSENLLQHICKPLNLYFTAIGDASTTNNSTEVLSYELVNKQWQEKPSTQVRLVDAANGIVSTATDLTTFINALFTNQLIRKETLALMTQTKDGFGLGITQIPIGDRKFFGHAGRIDGFEAAVLYYPSEKLGLAALYNGVQTNTNQLNVSILSIYYQQPFMFPDFTDLPISEIVLKTYEGIYKCEPLQVEIKIYMQQGKLYAQASGQNAFPLAAKSDTQFQFDPARIKIEFKKNQFTLNQPGTSYVFTKQKAVEKQ